MAVTYGQLPAWLPERSGDSNPMKRFLLLSALFVCVAAGRADGARLPRNVVPEQYKLILTPHIEIGRFLGNTTITVRVKEPVREITMHAADLDIGSVHVRDSVRKQRAQVSLDPETSTMTLRLRRELVPGTAEIRISYEGPLRDDLRGLYVSRSAPDIYLFTQLQPTDARRLFPSFDEPDLKARFDVTVVVDEEHVAISNSKVISILPGPRHGTRRIRFATTPPLSTYMLALAIGPLDCLSGRHGDLPLRFCAQRGMEGKGRAIFEGTRELLSFYEEWFGLPYPFDKLDVVALPDMAPGGMENPGAVFLREGWALVDRDAGLDAQRWSSTLLAHEISHMWVGDLATLEWWSDLWLNEGLATWISLEALRAWRPEIGVDDMQTIRRIRTFDQDSLVRRAVAGPIEGNETLFELFDLVATEKPAAMMEMVEQVVGKDELRRAIRSFLITYAWSNASTDEFVAHIESELGADAANVIRSYTSQPGYPVIGVSTTCVDGSLRMTLAQENGSEGSWHVPVCHRSLSGDAAPTCQIISGSATVDVPGSCSVPILVNPGRPGYYRVRYSRGDLDRILRASASMSAYERANLLDNEWSFVVSGERSVGDYLAMLETGFADEREPTLVAMINARLALVEKQFATPEQRGELRAWTRTYFGPQIARLGTMPLPGENQKTAMLRREVVWGAGALGRDPAIIELARQNVRQLFDDPSSVDRSLADTMLHLAARSGDVALYNSYLARVRRARDPQDGYRFLMGLTSFTSPDLVQRTIELTMTNVVRPQDASSVVGKLLGNPDSAEAAWQVVRQRWPEITKRLPETFTSERIVYGTGSFCSAERRDEVAAFFRNVTAPPRTLDASLARIDRCIAARPFQTAALGQWLDESSRLASSGPPTP